MHIHTYICEYLYSYEYMQDVSVIRKVFLDDNVASDISFREYIPTLRDLIPSLFGGMMHLYIHFISVYMYICICTYMYVYINVQTYMYMYTHTYSYTYICIIYIYIYMYICDFYPPYSQVCFVENLCLYLQHVHILYTPLISLFSCIILQ
jgi:hypothetical protein